MFGYSRRTNGTWSNYLSNYYATQHAIAPIMEKQTNKIIASQDRLANVIQLGNDRISAGISELSDDIRQLNASFNWGFNQIIISMGHLNDSLDKLISLVSNPSHTWSMEQYNIARDALNQKLYDDALDYGLRAINGYGDHTGYRLEYRFHMLVGLVHFGNFDNTDEKILNLEKSENYFLDAAKYARTYYPDEAAIAYLYAGKAAYCNGEMEKSLSHFQNAIDLSPYLSEAAFQKAKVNMYLDNPNNAMPDLRSAISLDRNYAIKAMNDGDFTPHEPHVSELISDLRDGEKREYLADLEKFDNKFSKLETLLPKLSAADIDFSDVTNMKENAHKEAKTETFFGYQDANQILKQTQGNLKNKISSFISKERMDAYDRHQDIMNDFSIKSIKENRIKSRVLCWSVLTLVALIIVALSTSVASYTGSFRETPVLMGIIIFFGLIVALVIDLSGGFETIAVKYVEKIGNGTNAIEIEKHKRDFDKASKVLDDMERLIKAD